MIEQSQLLITASLFTLILLVQILHYPFFHFIEKDHFFEAMLFHQRRISYVVMPLMLLELFLSVFAAYNALPGSYISLGIVVCIWLSTFFLQVPLHTELTQGKDHLVIDNLVLSNLLRTFLWGMKLVTIILVGL